MTRERAILVGIDWTGRRDRPSEGSLAELTELAVTAGAEVVAQLTQRRTSPDPAYFLGLGKAKELAAQAGESGANLVIFDEDLKPAQLRNLEEITDLKVVDRTGLILDIFAQRARTREAKVQVELAQLDYLLPRLSGHGAELSRLGGGIGTRGPGETKLEADRRRIRRRMVELRRELTEVKNQRALMRRPRIRAEIATMALVGYTNAGKSTLFNALTASDVPVEDKLFSTLDPTVRQLTLPGRQQAILADTVGFIRKLPHQLVAAFRATLEEVTQADLLLHVLDSSVSDLAERCAAVQSVLSELGIGGHPLLTVLNKVDLLSEAERAMRQRDFPPAYAVSARTGWGLAELRQGIAEYLASRRCLCRLFLPFASIGLLGQLHSRGTVHVEEYREDGVEIVVELDVVMAERFRGFRV